MVFGSLLSSVLLVSGPIAMLLLFAFVSVFFRRIALCFRYLRGFRVLNLCRCVIFGPSFACVLGLHLAPDALSCDLDLYHRVLHPEGPVVLPVVAYHVRC